MSYQKKKLMDVMLDLETLGAGVNPVIVQIAAVAFDIKTGNTFEEFDQLISPRSSVKAGLHCDGSTLEWWLTQDKEVFQKIVSKAIESGKDIIEVLSAYSAFIEEVKQKHNAYDVKVWSNGFDNSWLAASYLATRKDLPYPFWQCNDVRSLVDVSRRELDFDAKKNTVFTGKPHDAIDDCKHQIKYLVAIIKKMKGEK